VIAGGTAITVTSRGSATASPSTATFSSGTATCSGTPTVSVVTGGSPGNALLQLGLVTSPL
jgi:hypothetical protein